MSNVHVLHFDEIEAAGAKCWIFCRNRRRQRDLFSPIILSSQNFAITSPNSQWKFWKLSQSYRSFSLIKKVVGNSNIPLVSAIHNAGEFLRKKRSESIQPSAVFILFYGRNMSPITRTIQHESSSFDNRKKVIANGNGNRSNWEYWWETPATVWKTILLMAGSLLSSIGSDKLFSQFSCRQSSNQS